MKYIKHFEQNQLNSDRFPKKVSEEEFINRRRYGFDSFTTYETNKIREILNNKKRSYSLSSDILEINGWYTTYEILKLADEYFTIIISNQRTEEYYICDGFEELYNFLNRKVG